MVLTLDQMIDFGRWQKNALQRRKITPPSRTETWIMRVLIILGLGSMGLFLWWFIRTEHIGNPLLFWLLTGALGFKILHLLHEWYHYAAISVPEMPESTREWTVDMLTTFCAGEPYDMVIDTMKAMKAVRYPHTSYLCDEANDPYLKKVCEELGVVHVYRGTDKTDAKAGNINYALRNFATGELAVILDPDHKPEPDFLDRVVNYFEDPEIGYVQCVQAYRNRQESFIAKGAAEQTYHFYGPMMMSMNTYGTAQAIGANCTFRRDALDSIGGHASGLCEDMHTAMRIHAEGWKSVYVPELLTRGLVPSTLSSYYKQQMKWSRGAFELLFFEFPALVPKLTFRQIIHYFTIPLYFLSGLVGLIDISVPVLSLVMAEVAWHVQIVDLLMVASPLIAMSMLIRQFAQRFMLEEHERGFHLLGGFLRFGSWWVFLIGFIYSLLRIKVPYIPTPKDDQPTNAWKLSLPNISAILISIFAIIYGLSIDWNPYSIMMAFFAFTNVVILTVVFFMSQQKMMIGLYQWLGMDELITGFRSFWWNLRHYILYPVIRNSSLVLAILVLITLSGYSIYEGQQKKILQENALKPREKVTWFYYGLETTPPSTQEVSGSISAVSEGSYPGMKVFYLNDWGGNIPQKEMKLAARHGSVPVLKWLPARKDSSLSPAEGFLFQDILSGKYDSQIRKTAREIRKFNHPVIINFAPGADNPDFPWFRPSEDYAVTYRKAWSHVVSSFADEGVHNITWAWTPHDPANCEEFFPGEHFVQWISVNHTRTIHTVRQLEESYQAFSSVFSVHENLNTIPVMVEGVSPDLLVLSEEIRTIFPEIRALILRSRSDLVASDWKVAEKWLLSEAENGKTAPFIAKDSRLLWKGNDHQEIMDVAAGEMEITRVSNQDAELIRNINGSYELMVDNQPFYIQGVAYNATHDWRDGYLPLTRRQLLKDFNRIKAMGANTIRRYGRSGLYDHNMLTLAEETELKVLYGLWFDPTIDYYADTLEVEKIKRKVLHSVKELKSYPAIMGWVLGNETWSSLGLSFEQPYLSRVRQGYLAMIEELAVEIKKADPGRLIFTALEHNNNLPAAIYAHEEFVPSVDIIGVNTYYGKRIESLDEIMSRLNRNRPYLISAFGPRKYWDASIPGTEIELIPVENTSFEKAQLYGRNWEKHIASNRGSNIGGIAFCWSDRMEGTATWFGITDFKGRLKPSYYALKNVWKDEQNPPPLYEAYIFDPGYALQRGETYTFWAVTENNRSWNMTYEWYLLREKYLDDSGDVKLAFNGKKASIKIPNDEYSYRLYLYISDYYGNVVTASKPLNLLPSTQSSLVLVP